MAFSFPALDGSAPEKKKFDAPPEMGIDVSKRYTATIDTSMGSIVVALDAVNAPKTVNNFVFLAAHHFYDKVIFHRIVPGFVLQGGDPEGSGMGGPGYTIDEEPVTRRYEYGSLAMAKRREPGTTGSQFFIVCRNGGPALQPLYSHFGQVVKGLDVVDAIEAVPLRGESPVTPVVINSVTITVAD